MSDLSIERLEDLAGAPKLNYAAPTVQAIARELLRRRTADAKPMEAVLDDGGVPPREIPTSPEVAVSGLKTWHLSEGGIPRCNACGYSARDCALHLDHHRCPNPDPPEASGV